jgi:succinate-semialdehyde dehydrogenase/glutarate-semialdehyde dehydrogenase
MRAREEDLAELIVLENGKAFPDALGEVRYAAEFFRWFSEEASRVGGEVRLAPAGDKRIMTVRQPVGVSVLITPWNFPAAMATRKIGPALAAGCTTILKPASDTPLTTLAVVHLMEEAGLPPGVVNVVVAKGSSGVIEQMLHDTRVRKLSFRPWKGRWWPRCEMPVRHAPRPTGSWCIRRSPRSSPRCCPVPWVR